MSSRLLIVSNRLPITVRRRGSIVELHDSVGGLATGLRGPHEKSDGWWIGWPGSDLESLGDLERASVDRQLLAARAVPVELTESEREEFYERLCNAILWPLFHDRLDRLPMRLDGWDAYE